MRTAALAAGALLALSACGGTSGARRDAVGISLPTRSAQRWVSDGAELTRQFRAAGYRPDLEYASDVAQSQADQLEAMLVRGVRALVVAPVAPDAPGAARLGTVLEQARARGVRVVAYDRPVRGNGAVDAYAAYDSAEAGRLQARDLVRRLGLDGTRDPARGPATVELFAGPGDDAAACAAYDAALGVLRPLLDTGRLVVRSGQTDPAAVATLRGSPAAAQTRLRALLQAYPGGGPEAVLSPTDAISTALLATLADAGYGMPGRPLPLVTGRDAELPAVRAVASGRQASTVLTDPRRLAAAAVGLTRAALTGSPPPAGATGYDDGVRTVPAVLLPPLLVDRGNYRQVLVASGRYTRAQLDG